MLRKTLIIILLLSVSFGLSCIKKPIDRYKCQSIENWASAQCNPPICLKTRICTQDLYPQQYWDSMNLQIFLLSYNQLRTQDWINKRKVEGLTLEGYIEGQNLRYIEALKNNDEDLINRLMQDSHRVGFILLPSKFLGGNKNNE